MNKNSVRILGGYLSNYLSRIRQKKKLGKILCLSVNLKNLPKGEYDFSFIKPIMLMDFTTLPLSVLHLSFVYQAELFCHKEPEQDLVLHTYIKEHIKERFGRASGHILLAVPDQWVMTSYISVPENMRKSKIYHHIKTKLKHIFPYHANQLYFDFMPVPDNLLTDSHLAVANLYQVFACESAKIKALMHLLKPFNCTLVLACPYRHCVFIGNELIRQHLAENDLTKGQPTRKKIKLLFNQLKWSDLQTYKIVLGLQSVY